MKVKKCLYIVYHVRAGFFFVFFSTGLRVNKLMYFPFLWHIVVGAF